MDRLTRMSVFVTVVDQGNFSAAAAHLKCSRASTSKHIAALENCLGGRLLNRTTRRISLTEAGQVYYERCKQILEDVAQAECVVTGYASEPRGLLRINAPMSFGTRQFADIIATFCQDYPTIDVELNLNDRLVDVIEEGYDLVIRITQLKASSLIARKLAPYRRVLCASSGYLKRYGRPEEPKDLDRHSCLHYACFEGGRNWVLRGPDGEHRISINPQLSANNGDVLCLLPVRALGSRHCRRSLSGMLFVPATLRLFYPPTNRRRSISTPCMPPGSTCPQKCVNLLILLSPRLGGRPVWDAAL